MILLRVGGGENDFVGTFRGGTCSNHTHPKLVLGAMEPEFLQADGQVIHTDSSVSVHVQDLEQDLEAMLLLGAAAHGADMRLVFRRRDQSTNTDVNAANPAAWVGKPILLGAALAQHTAQNRRDKRALLVHHAGGKARDCSR